MENIGYYAIGRVLLHELFHLGAEEAHSLVDFAARVEIVDFHEVFEAFRESGLMGGEVEVVDVDRGVGGLSFK